MKKTAFLLLLLSAVFGLSLLASAQEIKLAALTTPGSPQRMVAEKFKELVEAQSAGKFTVTIAPSGFGPQEVEAIDWVQTNTVQMGVITASAFEDLDPIARAISFPFLFRNEEQAAAILDGPLGATIFRDLETIGCKGLSFSETGFEHLTNSIRPVKTLADLAGLRIRITSSPLAATFWLSLGANPTPKSWPIYSDLEQKVLEGQESPLWVIEAYRFFEVQKYLALTRHRYIAHIGVASLRWWDSLSRQDQEMLRNAMVEAARFQRADQRAKEAARLTFLKSKGMVIEEQPDIEAFRNKTARLKELPIYREPRVQVLLAKMQEAALLQPQPTTIIKAEYHETSRPDGLPRQRDTEASSVFTPGTRQDSVQVPPRTDPLPHTAPESNLTPIPTETEIESPSLDQHTPQPQQEVTKPAESVHQSAALEPFEAPRPTEPPAQVIHQGQTTSEGETPPPIIEERIPAAPYPAQQPPANSKAVTEPQQTDATEQPQTSPPPGFQE